jgi:hypothetical protein
MNNYKRIFTFGCSFSNYAWPTWADVIAIQTKIPVYNGAIAGLGNVGILHRLLEYDLKFKFNDDDLVLVMWTSWSREDRFLDGSWKNVGNVFNNNFYDDHFTSKYWSWDNDIIKNATSIILANRCFSIAQNYTALSHMSDIFGKHVKSDKLSLYVNDLPQSIMLKVNSNFEGRIYDSHPDIINHVTFYNNQISDKFGFPKVELDSCLYEWQKYIVDNVPQTTWKEQSNFIIAYLNQYKKLMSIKL